MRHYEYKIHYRNIGMFNNAGVSMPICQHDHTRTFHFGEWADITCKKCLKLAPKKYDWVAAIKGPPGQKAKE